MRTAWGFSAVASLVAALGAACSGGTGAPDVVNASDVSAPEASPDAGPDAAAECVRYPSDACPRDPGDAGPCAEGTAMCATSYATCPGRGCMPQYVCQCSGGAWRCSYTEACR